MMWRSRVVITTDSDRQIIFRIPRHLIIHEWIKQIHMIELVACVCELLRPIQGTVRECRHDSRRCPGLKSDHYDRPGQPHENNDASGFQSSTSQFALRSYPA